MEKPKNYWLRAQIAIGFAVFAKITLFIPVIRDTFYLRLFSNLISLVAIILCVTQAIRYRDWRYFLLGFLSFLIIFSFIFIGLPAF